METSRKAIPQFFVATDIPNSWPTKMDGLQPEMYRLFESGLIPFDVGFDFEL